MSCRLRSDDQWIFQPIRAIEILEDRRRRAAQQGEDESQDRRHRRAGVAIAGPLDQCSWRVWTGALAALATPTGLRCRQLGPGLPTTGVDLSGAAGHCGGPHERERSGVRSRSSMLRWSTGLRVLAQIMWTMKGWQPARPAQIFLLDSGAPFCCYETSDGKYMAVGAIRPVLPAALLSELGLSAA